MTTPKTNVTVLGLGIMGRGIAASLLRAGIPTSVWNRNPSRSMPLAADGAQVATDVTGAAQHAHVAITMVTDADAVLDVADKQGMLKALPPHAIWVQMSTIGVDGFDRVAELAKRERPDVMLVDAPVTGSRQAAESGSLTIFASGPDDARTPLAPVFAAIGRRTIWFGAAGLGTRIKLVNNTLIAFTVQGMGEAAALAQHLGVTPEATIEAIESGTLASPYVMGKLGRIARGDYSPEFSLNLALKDVNLALDALNGSPHPVFRTLAHDWWDATTSGLGGQDLTVITRTLAAQS